jgi:hypothetical protein
LIFVNAKTIIKKLKNISSMITNLATSDTGVISPKPTVENVITLK